MRISIHLNRLRPVFVYLMKINTEVIIISNQKPEARSQKPEARSQKPEARSQKPEANAVINQLSSNVF